MRRLTALFCSLALLACGSEPSGLDDGGDPDVVAAISVEQGAEQSARAMRVMPDSVVGRATDDQGRAVEGRIVEFQLPAGPDAGSVDQQTLATNPQGRVFYELTAGPRAWTSRVAAGEDSAYTARLVASVDGRSDEVVEFTFAVQPGDPVELDLFFSTGDPPVLRPGDTVNPLDMLEWPARDQHGNPLPGSMIDDRSAGWVYLFSGGDVEAEGPSGTGWDAGPLPELHREGWHDSNAIRTTTGDGSTLPDSLEVRGGMDWTSGDLGDHLSLRVMLPACWEHTRTLDDGREEFEAVPWTEGCPAPEDQV